MPANISLLSGNGNRPFAEKVATHLSMSLLDAVVGRFNDGEAQIGIGENVRGTHAFILNHTGMRNTDGDLVLERNIFESVLLADAAGSAMKVTLVIPYSGYNRQDRQDGPREPISAVPVANLLMSGPVTGVVLFDLHSPATVGLYRKDGKSVDHVYARPVILDWLLRQELPEFALSSVDDGGSKRIGSFTRRLTAAGLKFNRAVADKRKNEANGIETTIIIGDVRDRLVICIDDMVDSGSSAISAAQACLTSDAGAKDVWLIATHLVMSNPAHAQRLVDSPISKIVVTDTMPIVPSVRQVLEGAGPDRFIVLSVAGLMALVIKHLAEDRRVSPLLEVAGYRAGLVELEELKRH